MKVSSFLLPMTAMFLALRVWAADPTEPTPYPVRDIPQDSEKFEKIYEVVATQRLEAEMAALKTHEVEILQTISPGRYRVRIGETSYAMEIPIGRTLADGEKVRLPALESDEVYQYTTVFGATATIKVAVVPELPKRMTKQTFLRRLAAGETFEIAMNSEKVRCVVCGGFGYVSSVTKERCRRCYGEGIFEFPKRFLVMW